MREPYPTATLCDAGATLLRTVGLARICPSAPYCSFVYPVIDRIGVGLAFAAQPRLEFVIPKTSLENAAMLMATKTRGNVHGSLAFWIAFLLSLRRPPAASEEVDCRNVSGYTSGPGPDTCTAQLPLIDTETEVIRSLNAECQSFPFKCHRKYYCIPIVVEKRKLSI